MTSPDNSQRADAVSHSAEKFPLLRRFSIVSLAAMLVTAALLAFLYRSDQQTASEHYFAEKNGRILSHLAGMLNEPINALLANSTGVNSNQAMQPNPDPLFASLLTYIYEYNILKLKIYNPAGITIYSSAKSEIGKGSRRPDLLARALRGETVHDMEHRDTFLGMAGEMHDVNIYMTYMPLLHDGKQIGVIESYDDVSRLVNHLNARAIQIGLLALGIFGALYASLFLTIFRADRAVDRWQKAVAESEERCKFALEGARDGVWDWNPQTDEALFSKRWEEMLGYAEHKFPGTGAAWVEHLHPDDKDRVLSAIRQYFADEQPFYTTEFRMRCKDGSWKWILSRGMLIRRDADGNPLRMIGTNTDITERKQSEEALRIAATTFETHEAILIADVHANIIRVNRAFSEITGYSAEEVLGKNPRIMSSGRHDRSFYIEMWQRLLHTGNWAGEVFDRRKNGEIYPKWMTITAVKNDQQETTHYVAIFSDITARKRIEEEIHNLAFYDALTKLPNRRLFFDRFRTALVASARRDDYGAVLFVDLDRFKALNDTLGHEYGDLMLVEVGARIKSCVREMDTVARFGGDEFVVLIEAFGNQRDDVTRKVALVAEKIREALARPYNLKGHEYHSSPSIGISLYHDNDDSLESLIEHADMAMYQAKNCGRNTVRFFDPIMQQNATTHDALDNDLHYAIELQQLHLHYQIQVDNHHHPLGAEAFLRWEHPERGVVMPGHFIPIAEESTLIIDISRWVLQSACRQLAGWGRHDKTRNLTLTINISARHFGLPDFVDEVADMLKAHQADPTRLKMELSEKLVLAEANSTMDKIHALRNLGVRLTMDNFNTVYSSLSFIKELSSDQLKIHQEFVQGITKEGNDAQLVQTIIDLAKSLDLDVFAEGVETEEQRAFLKKYGCNAYQGYLFGKPMSVEEFEKAIKRL